MNYTEAMTKLYSGSTVRRNRWVKGGRLKQIDGVVRWFCGDQTGKVNDVSLYGITADDWETVTEEGKE